jgi:hypothetical protein
MKLAGGWQMCNQVCIKWECFPSKNPGYVPSAYADSCYCWLYHWHWLKRRGQDLMAIKSPAIAVSKSFLSFLLYDAKYLINTQPIFLCLTFKPKLNYHQIKQWRNSRLKCGHCLLQSEHSNDDDDPSADVISLVPDFNDPNPPFYLMQFFFAFSPLMAHSIVVYEICARLCWSQMKKKFIEMFFLLTFFSFSKSSVANVVSSTTCDSHKARITLGLL